MNLRRANRVGPAEWEWPAISVAMRWLHEALVRDDVPGAICAYYQLIAHGVPVDKYDRTAARALDRPLVDALTPGSPGVVQKGERT